MKRQSDNEGRDPESSAECRVETALELFRNDEVSLLRAAEIADLDFWSFRLLLQQRGIPWVIEADSPEEMDRRLEAFFATPHK